MPEGVMGWFDPASEVGRIVKGADGPVASSSLLVSTIVPPTLTVEAAREWLDETNAPQLFFADAATGRGTVIYHRSDGHYGHITSRRAENRGETDVP